MEDILRGSEWAACKQHLRSGSSWVAGTAETHSQPVCPLHFVNSKLKWKMYHPMPKYPVNEQIFVNHLKQNKAKG